MCACVVGSGSGDEGLVDCRKLAESIYTVFLGSHDSHTLKCLKQCPAEKYRWFHGFTTRDDLSLIRDSYELTVVMAHPPRHTDVGHFCCGCVGDRPKESCCVGVARKPWMGLCTLLNWVVTVAQCVSVLGQSLNLLSSIFY